MKLTPKKLEEIFDASLKLIGQPFIFRSNFNIQKTEDKIGDIMLDPFNNTLQYFSHKDYPEAIDFETFIEFNPQYIYLFENILSDNMK